MKKFKNTTIISVRKNNEVAMGGDGQVSFGHTIMKKNTSKVRKIFNDQVIVGFAGSTADAFTLFERFEGKLKEYHGHLTRAAIELAKDWRTDRILRKLEALLAVVNTNTSLIISGNGDVIQPENNLITIGSGGPYAQASANALINNTNLTAKEIVEKSLDIAADICIYTNKNKTIELLKCTIN